MGPAGRHRRLRRGWNHDGGPDADRGVGVRESLFFTILSEDNHHGVRESSLEHVGPPNRIVTQLAEDPNGNVRGAALHHPSCSAEALTLAASSPSRYDRSAVAAHVNTPHPVRAHLAADRATLVRSGLTDRGRFQGCCSPRSRLTLSPPFVSLWPVTRTLPRTWPRPRRRPEPPGRRNSARRPRGESATGDTAGLIASPASLASDRIPPSLLGTRRA